MGQTSADQQPERRLGASGSDAAERLPADRVTPPDPDPLARLVGIADVPLAEQVAVFDAIHSHLSSRLTSAEN